VILVYKSVLSLHTVSNGGFESSAWTTQNSTGFPATSFYYGSSGIALPNTGTYAQTISNLANGMLVSEAMGVAPGTHYTVNTYTPRPYKSHQAPLHRELRTNLKPETIFDKSHRRVYNEGHLTVTLFCV